MDTTDVASRIRTLAADTIDALGAPLRTITLAHLRQLAHSYNIPEREVAIAALANGVTPLRYLRNRKHYTTDDQIRLLDARVAVIGLGGLGGAVVEILARAGVGHLKLIDGDHFEEHNLNRQWLCTEARLGQSKAGSAALRVREIDPSLQVESHVDYLTEANAQSLIDGCDVVVDCLDSITVRFILEKAARKAAIPMVSAAVAGLAGHVTTIFPQDAGLQLVYGPGSTIHNALGAEQTLGCPPQTVALIAAAESAEVLNILVGRPHTLLRNRLWVLDLATYTFEVFSLV
jgi:molybdopterin/thiamine biosynthesis adenylyltransferase